MIQVIVFALVLCLLFCGVVIVRGCARHYHQEHQIAKLKNQLRTQEASSQKMVVRRRKAAGRSPRTSPRRSPSPSPSPAADEASLATIQPGHAAQIIQQNIERRYERMAPSKRIMARLIMPIAQYVLTTPDEQTEESEKTALQSMCYGIFGATTELARAAGVPLIVDARPPN